MGSWRSAVSRRAAEIVAHATPAQLMCVFDLDSAQRRGGPGRALRSRSVRAVARGARRHERGDGGGEAGRLRLRPRDRGPDTSLPGPRPNVGHDAMASAREQPQLQTAGYTLFAKRSEPSDAFLALMTELETGRPDFFGRLMARCCAISIDHVDDNDSLYHVASAEDQVLPMSQSNASSAASTGIRPPSQASRFLESRDECSCGGQSAPSRDGVTAGYFRNTERRAAGSAVPGQATSGRRQDMKRSSASRGWRSRTTVVDRGQLQYWASTTRPPTSAGSRSSATSRTRWLPAVLQLTIVHGWGSVPEAAVAISNLGLENWPGEWQPSGNVATLTPHCPKTSCRRDDLVSVFQVGLTTLHEQVGLHTLERLREALGGLTCQDDDVQSDIVELCRWLEECRIAGTPWRVRDRLDVIAILARLAGQRSWALSINARWCRGTPVERRQAGACSVCRPRSRSSRRAVRSNGPAISSSRCRRCSPDRAFRLEPEGILKVWLPPSGGRLRKAVRRLPNKKLLRRDGCRLVRHAVKSNSFQLPPSRRK